MFIDEISILAIAGKGGDGCSAFLREKHRPWGGPSGGDGGKGGDIIFQASRQVDTLLNLYRSKKLVAPNGQPGQNKNRSGRGGKALEVPVPLGTLIKRSDSEEVLCDLVEEGQTFSIKGGRGGRGNQHFATATHQTPREFEFGTDGEEIELHLELKLIADVGLIGLPNAGKSTLLSRISAAHPRIAPYAFTTKEPQLGIVSSGDYTQIVVADLPGLIEGAHTGAGMGDEFLRHVERTSFLVHLIDMAPLDGSDPAENYRLIERELTLYSEVLAKRPRLIVANKMDLTGAEENLERFRTEINEKVLSISGVTGKGLDGFLAQLMEQIQNIKRKLDAAW